MSIEDMKVTGIVHCIKTRVIITQKPGERICTSGFWMVKSYTSRSCNFRGSEV